MSRLLILILLGLLIVRISHADIYKFVDKDGRVQYTDKPQGLPAEPISKKQTPRTDQSALADQVAAELKARDATAKAQAIAKPSASEKQKATEITAPDKAKQCLDAQGKYENITTSHHLYTLDAKGERTYLDDKQIAQAIAAAKAQIDTWCN